MLKAKYSIYINDNSIYLSDNKIKIYEKQLSNLKRDEILNDQKFYFEFNQFIRKNKIKISLFGHKINLIINDNLSEIQREKYKEILEEYFKKIEFINVSYLLPLYKNTLVINITQDYIDFYYMKTNVKQLVRVDKILFNNNDFKAISHVCKTVFIPEKIILFGSDNSIPNLTEKINKELGIQCSYQEKHTKYILTEVWNYAP